MFKDTHHIHFIGIGGSGISSLVHLAVSKGMKVTGSDSVHSPITNNLEKEGIKIFFGHDAKHITDLTEMVIFTEAIDPNTNPEYLEAKKRELPMMSYFEALSDFSKQKKTIVVIGSHGKTTTTGMLGVMMKEAGLDPLVILGSTVKQFNNHNIHAGLGEYFVVEGCEYRRSFLNLQPFGVVLLNCEADHLDYYKSEADYVNAFIELMTMIPEDGFLIYNTEDKNSLEIAKHAKCKIVGLSQAEADKLPFELKVPGDFNRMNASMVREVAKILNIEDEGKAGLESFNGTARRLEIVGEFDGVTLINDYAHHPTEIKATLKAIKEHYKGRRIICSFQPHQYSRTYELLEGFKTSFNDADVVIVPNIYAARDTEETKSKINGKSFAEALIHPDGRWGEDFDTTFNMLKEEAKEGDIIIIMGAGDQVKIVDRFI